MITFVFEKAEVGPLDPIPLCDPSMPDPSDEQVRWMGEHLTHTLTHQMQYVVDVVKSQTRTDKSILGVGYVLNPITLFVEHQVEANCR